MPDTSLYIHIYLLKYCFAGAIVGISCAILVVLFLGQSVGTSKLGHAFAPVLILFFISNAAVGIYNIVR